jgi:hypothetical protein
VELHLIGPRSVCHISRMERYTISPDDSGGVSVDVLYESGVTGFHWFKTETEAKAWVARQRAEVLDLPERHEAGNWPI